MHICVHENPTNLHLALASHSSDAIKLIKIKKLPINRYHTSSDE